MVVKNLANTKEIFILLASLWKKISRRRRTQFFLLLIIVLLASLSEVVSIGAVVPFLAAIINPEQILRNPLVHPLLLVLNINTPDQLILPFSILFGCAALVAGLLRLFLIWCSSALSSAIGMDIGLEMYRRALYQPYSTHIKENSSEVMVGIVSGTSNAVYTMSLAITLVSSSILLAAIFVTLLAINPEVALLMTGAVSLIYVVIIWVTKRRLSENSIKISRNSKSIMRIIHEGLGGIRDILLDRSQEEFCRGYVKYDVPMRKSMAESNFISQGPRYLIEALGIVFIVCLSYRLVLGGFDQSNAILLLGSLALGAQRLLPILQQGYSAWTSILGMRASLEDVLRLLNQPLTEEKFYLSSNKLFFNEKIELTNIWFRYSPDSAWVLKDVNLAIKRGERVGFIGKTGEGKSTLIDIIMRLLQPTRGTLAIDGNFITGENVQSWQAKIAHVPQFIFLADSSIASNIAFGVPIDKIDYDRVFKAALAAQLSEYIEALPDQFETNVGERGVKLSGGQRQRIGIARAFYRSPEVIIFDEATSALDSETESAIMQSIERMGEQITILVIAHRLETLKMCSRVMRISDCGVSEVPGGLFHP